MVQGGVRVTPCCGYWTVPAEGLPQREAINTTIMTPTLMVDCLVRPWFSNASLFPPRGGLIASLTPSHGIIMGPITLPSSRQQCFPIQQALPLLPPA